MYNHNIDLTYKALTDEYGKYKDISLLRTDLKTMPTIMLLNIGGVLGLTDTKDIKNVLWCLVHHYEFETGVKDTDIPKDLHCETCNEFVIGTSSKDALVFIETHVSQGHEVLCNTAFNSDTVFKKCIISKLDHIISTLPSKP